MNNKIIIAIVAAVVVIGAGVWLFAFRGGPAVPPGVKVNNPETLAALMAAGAPVKCTIVPSADNSHMSGTFYVAGKQVRGDYSVATGGQTMMGHMIAQTQTTYTWFDGQPMGFKMANTLEPGNTGNVPVAESQGFDPNQKLGYQCEGWVMDASKFAVPTNIKFSEFGPSAEITTPPAGGSGSAGAVQGTAAQCAACDQVPASYKAQCKASLGCK